MSKKKTNSAKNNSSAKKQQNKSNLPWILAAIVVVCVVIIAVAIPRGGNQNNITADTDNVETAGDSNIGDSENASSGSDNAQVIEAGDSLIIPTDEISDTARFYPVEVDGTRMEILAVKDSDGNIRTAFNTCQICYSSGRGYYVQDGNTLVCQNCGNRFTVDQVEIESGGCNPWPIFADDKTVTEDSIEISYDFLNESKEIFANWKTSY